MGKKLQRQEGNFYSVKMNLGGRREEVGWLHVTCPCLSQNGGWSSYKGGSPFLFSLRIKAPFTGSVTSCVPESCVGNYSPSLGTKDHPTK